MKKIIELATKYRVVLMYLIFGVLTTIINIFVFWYDKELLIDTGIFSGVI